MLELYQFELSQYSEKVRFILDYKGLDYRKVEVTPGVGQLDLFQKSGHRQVPVLKDGDTYIGDSTDIAFYLERKYPEKPLLPSNPRAKGFCLMMEEWADESIGLKGRKALIGALNKNQNFRTSILPKEVPDFLKNLVGAIPGDLLDVLGSGVGLGGDSVKEAVTGLKQDLEALCLILESQPYLVGNTPSLADFTVAGLSMVLKFPDGNYLDIPEHLKGKGIPELADNSAYAPFFAWRDRLYAEFRQPLTPQSPGDAPPTPIEIE
ncbi:glutathione S-transferase family protein [Spirulina subsalsa FACHB-351]|uniref:Glutathione S-transferase family protein n=1 Tax=Spirulina subsalsa FACHB-351 TaxID=234711 RepID=A0ABT3L4H2_9CYAN|nr:glutathione S-transferase family protein [Spirulina subsalsa]MCW6036397.1 glutathione S-transferase family protein [Spirulina subsalsa FACHB-351]